MTDHEWHWLRYAVYQAGGKASTTLLGPVRYTVVDGETVAIIPPELQAEALAHGLAIVGGVVKTDRYLIRLSEG